MLAGMFEGFTLERIDVGEAELRVRHGGSGPPLVLLHGHPRTHTTWHGVAPLLASSYTVVCPDLRGYGESSKPETTPDHAPYSKRAMGNDVVALMAHLGHDSFALLGHDRGALAAFHTALDHPDRVAALAIADGLPVVEHLERCDERFASAWWHWFFFAQTEKPAEHFISLDPDAWYKPNRTLMGAENLADYERAIHDPATVHAMVEDYRAGMTVDRAREEEARAAGEKVRCPLLFLWSERDDMEELYGDPLAIWRDWADDVRGHGIDSGHHIAEEAPEALADALRAFLGEVYRR
jgi:haloacetate dehalogenase